MAEQPNTPDPEEIAKAAAKAAQPKKASPSTVEDANAEDVAKAAAKAARPRKAQPRGTAVTQEQQDAAIEKALARLKKQGYKVSSEPSPVDASPVSGAPGNIGASAAPVSAGTVGTGTEGNA